MLRDDVVDMRRNVLGAPEHVHDVNVARDVDQASIDWLPENLGDVGIVDRNRYDLEAGFLGVDRYEVRGLIGPRLGFDTENGNSVTLAKECADLVRRLDEARSPIGRWT